MKKISIKRIAFVAIFSALTSILYLYAKFNLPIFPSFLDINLSMIPVIICSFMLGPIDGGICVLVRCAIKLMFGLSSTSGVGELADVLIGLPTALYAGYMYNFTKLKHKELYAFLGLSVIWVLMGVISNWLINIPFYSNLYGENVIVGAVDPAVRLITFGNVSVNLDNYMPIYLVFAVIPFNLLIAVVVSLITLPVHKRLKVLYTQFDFHKFKKNSKNIDEEKTAQDSANK